MSLDVYLEGRHAVQCAKCSDAHECYGGVFSANITHNLNRMADAAGIYQAIWRPYEIGISRANELIPVLRNGLERLQAEPERFKVFNPRNGWGDYDVLVRFVADYLEACEKHLAATVRIRR